MKLRMNHREANPKVFEIMLQLETSVQSLGLDKTLYELVKIRASQLNNCAFCIDMHAKELQGMGEQFDRILLLSVWREVPIYTEREKAALELTEYLTRLSDAGLPDEVYARVRAQFQESEIAALILAINTINGWNRLGVATGMFPGCFL
ncbi:carboxymuconolactone decarboxylase family protein [Paenibacillus chartarius]|uniref:Carboxymuconolactone decarboxylase family protein n=1 Tax=Paenibacillus chartarius TaxID=747481 RepID=A0ABV6DR80_9BACL